MIPAPTAAPSRTITPSPLDEPRPASGALTKTGGFLAGFTHTLQPYIGCRFGCEYCYVKGLTVHRFHKPKAEWGDYAHPRTGIAERLATELRRYEQRGELDNLAIFMSSATDPYQQLERRWRLSRACLDVMAQQPPGLLVVQTRSPFVHDDFARLRALGRRCWLNITLETDDDAVRKIVTPRCPSIAQRVETIEAAIDFGLNVQVTVSPCLPYSSLETFGNLLLSLVRRPSILGGSAHPRPKWTGDEGANNEPHRPRIIVDSFTSGDGQGGRRTAKTDIPQIYAQQEWDGWQNEADARTLFKWLYEHALQQVGWSQEGFTTLAKMKEKN